MVMVFQIAGLIIPIAILILSMAALSFVSRYVIRSLEDYIEITGIGETSAGFAILSVITSTPEMLVAVFSILEESPALSVGDLLGSNVFNMGMVVGLLMLTSGFLKECPEGLDKVADILLLSSIIPLVLVVLEITNPIIGAGLIAIFVFSVYRETRTRTPTHKSIMQNSKGEGRRKKSKILLKIIAGTALIVVSAQFTVSSAINIAGIFGVIPLFIGARLVAIGTSLPELSLSLTAVKRGRIHLATANAIGSNLSNLTLILGIVFLSSAFLPFSINIVAFTEIISFVLITSLIMWYHLTKGGDCRVIGVILILTYIAFQATAITE